MVKPKTIHMQTRFEGIMGRCGSGKLMCLIFLLSPYPYSSSTYERFYDDINYITTEFIT